MNLQELSARHHCDQCSGTYGVTEAEDVSHERILPAFLVLVLWCIALWLWLSIGAAA